MNSAFEKGDRVIYTGGRGGYEGSPKVGKEGTVIHSDKSATGVRFDADYFSVTVWTENLALAGPNVIEDWRL